MELEPNTAGAIIAMSALGALALIVSVVATTRGARARAKEKAAAWAALKAPEWKARAERKRERRESGERYNARLRFALMSAVALVALAATNLSAHASIAAMNRVGLHSIDTAISVVVVFEAFLAILGALSLWHMTKGSGFNWYEVGVWSMASLMGCIAWWGGENIIFALWPILAAVAWHVVITFGREHKPSALITWYRMKRGKATSQDANALLTEQLITRIVNHGYAANKSVRLLRPLRSRLFDRAWAAADALGILTPEVRARIQTRVAARYVGARALAPEAVAHMNPWDERAPKIARSARVHTARPVSAPPAPVVEMSAHEEIDSTDDTASAIEASASVTTVSAPTDSGMESLIAQFFAGPEDAREWTMIYARTNGTLPTGAQLAEAFSKSESYCRKWVSPVRQALRA